MNSHLLSAMDPARLETNAIQARAEGSSALVSTLESLADHARDLPADG